MPYLVITPDVHRVHHSRDELESNRNYGAVLIWWDKIFGTYLSHGRATDAELRFGLQEFLEHDHLKPWQVLAMPLQVRNAPRRRRFAATGSG